MLPDCVICHLTIVNLIVIEIEEWAMKYSGEAQLAAGKLGERSQVAYTSFGRGMFTQRRQQGVLVTAKHP
jgi:hypothetical protein